jgi:hypothetical protein
VNRLQAHVSLIDLDELCCIMVRVVKHLGFALPVFLPAVGLAASFHVAVDGSDISGDGSLDFPWASITHAVDNVSDGDEVIVLPGLYQGRQRLRQVFDVPITVRSQIPYAARLRHDDGAVLTAYSARNVIVEGFDIAHAPGNSGPLVVHVQDLLGDVNGSAGGTDPVVSGIVFRNNIIHSSTNNDLLKINNGAENILVEGNLFFNQSGSDEHIDINSVIAVTVQDNIFLNTADRPDTSSFIVIKDSNGKDDTVLGANDITVRRNVFLNWYGSEGQGFVRVGEDGTANFEAYDILIENNLMLGNSAALMRSPLTVQGSRDVVFRNNTLVGDMPARSFAARLIAVGLNPANENIEIYNNIYADPTGSMGTEAYIGVYLFDAPIGQNDSIIVDNNLYFNGDQPIPIDQGQFLSFENDVNAVTGNPLLPAQTGLVAPVWDGNTFADGSTSIREAFVNLVQLHGSPAAGSPAIDSARSDQVPVDDILGNIRGPAPDIGAVETNPSVSDIFTDRFEVWLGLGELRPDQR